MSWYGTHPVLPKAEAQAARLEVGLPPCKRCTYWWRCFGGPHGLCERCSPSKAALKQARGEHQEYWSFFGRYARRDLLIEQGSNAIAYAQKDATTYHEWYAAGGRTEIVKRSRAA